ncbi:uncharacterized protein LOC127565100 isoform X1 [Drosophila albomicans]|uniref:Uncharacterized protein LOC127565100 isoform X1 n=1 Tax=Drosophila albomicans TaxID=7291 RepID=A0A9C6SLE2_DROAB|nr:uncharacterized protein LOC127565100 isoform X1 [Drosophila albomicans]
MQDTDTDRKLRSATTPDDETTCGNSRNFTTMHNQKTKRKGEGNAAKDKDTNQYAIVIQLKKWCILTYGPLTETRKSELVLFYICYKTGIMGVCQCKQLVFGNNTKSS